MTNKHTDNETLSARYARNKVIGYFIAPADFIKIKKFIPTTHQHYSTLVKNIKLVSVKEAGDATGTQLVNLITMSRGEYARSVDATLDSLGISILSDTDRSRYVVVDENLPNTALKSDPPDSVAVLTSVLNDINASGTDKHTSTTAYLHERFRIFQEIQQLRGLAYDLQTTSGHILYALDNLEHSVLSTGSITGETQQAIVDIRRSYQIAKQSSRYSLPMAPGYAPNIDPLRAGAQFFTGQHCFGRRQDLYPQPTDKVWLVVVDVKVTQRLAQANIADWTNNAASFPWIVVEDSAVTAIRDDAVAEKLYLWIVQACTTIDVPSGAVIKKTSVNVV